MIEVKLVRDINFPAQRVWTVLEDYLRRGALSPKIEELPFKIGGRIARFEVDEGTDVVRGQLLAQLETEDAKDKLNKQTVELGQAQRSYQRMKTLHNKGSIQKSQLEDSAACLEQVRIAHEQAKLNLRRCSLRATSEGLILKEFLESRTTVGAGQPIFSFQSNSGIWTTKADLTDRNAFALDKGARADIRFAPYPGVSFAGELTKLARIANPGDALYTAEITISAGEYSLRPDIVAEVDLYQTSEQNYSLVPFDALVDLRDTILISRSGSALALRDIANIRIAKQPDSIITRVNGKSSTWISMRLNDDANVFEVKRVMDLILDATHAQLYAGIVGLLILAIFVLQFKSILQPLALGNTMFKALAIVVIGGLTTSTFLTLLCLPVLFSLVTGESRPVQITQRWTKNPSGENN